MKYLKWKTFALLLSVPLVLCSCNELESMRSKVADIENSNIEVNSTVSDETNHTALVSLYFADGSVDSFTFDYNTHSLYFLDGSFYEIYGGGILSKDCILRADGKTLYYKPDSKSDDTVVYSCDYKIEVIR